HGIMPSAAPARRRAPATSAAPQPTSRPPNKEVQDPEPRTAALRPRVQFAKQRTLRTTTPVPAAASAVAPASNEPGRGSLSGPPGRPQGTPTSETRDLAGGT